MGGRLEILILNIFFVKIHMGHRDQDEKKVDEMSLFFKVRSLYGQMKAKVDIMLSPSILS